jgi:phosphate:Na+ symporter
MPKTAKRWLARTMPLFACALTLFSVPLAPASGPIAAQDSVSIAPGPAADDKRNDESKSQDKATGEESKARQELHPWSMGMAALAGLVLFIFGVTQLAQGLTELNSDRMRRAMERFTKNRFAGVATGTVATTLLESSSVTIIMVIAMVSGGILAMPQALGVVLGANIGTTIGAQLIAFDIAEYIPLLMLAGLLLMFVGKSELRHKLGMVLLGFGLLYYGLEVIDQAMKPLRTHGPFLSWMHGLGDRAVLGALVGCVVTLVIQSSSATVAIVITLAGSGLVSLPAGIAIMLGAEIGTCSDTLIATIGRGRPALRTGLFHLVFNLASAVLGVIFAPQLAKLVQFVSGGASIGRQIANAQIIFNLIGVTAILPFLPAVARLLERVVPDRKGPPTVSEPRWRPSPQA